MGEKRNFGVREERCHAKRKTRKIICTNTSTKSEKDILIGPLASRFRRETQEEERWFTGKENEKSKEESENLSEVRNALSLVMYSASVVS